MLGYYYANLGLVSVLLVPSQGSASVLQFSWDRPLSAMPLPQDLCGLSIEPDRFPDWAGNVTNANNFTYTLLHNLKVKTGLAPRIRVGGDTQDHIIYDVNITGDPGFYDVFAAVPSTISGTKQLFPEALYVGAGYNYWLCSGNFPEGTAFTWGVNFGVNNVSEAVTQVQEIEKAFEDPHCSNVTLDNIEMGNEADVWAGNYRTANWSVWEYKSQQVAYFKAINEALGYNGRKYRIADWAITWNSAQLFATNIMQSIMGCSINAISEHHYQGTADFSTVPSTVWPSIASDLTNKANIRGNLSRYSLSVMDAQRNGIPFVLGETNTFFGHGQPGVSNAAAAALWLVDYSLQAASIGVSGLYFHQGVGYNYSAFIPIDGVGINVTDYEPSAQRHILPAYYGYLAVADAIGSTGNAFVNELWTDNTNLAVYQIWEGHDLKRIMLINSMPWTESSEGERPVIEVNFVDLGNVTGARLKRLTFDSLSAYNGITWGEQSWENHDGIATGAETFEQLPSNGSVTMNASSVALVYL